MLAFVCISNPFPSLHTTNGLSLTLIYFAVIGRIRLAVGQSKLFINERFKQFSGLIDDCELKRGDKEIKEEDLAGFWDMIYYQVEDLKNKYAALEELERNNWDSTTESSSVETNGLVLNGDSKSNIIVNKQKRPVKTSPPNGQNGNAASRPVPAKKAAAGRSNFRDFLKSRKMPTNGVNGTEVEIVVMGNGKEAPIPPVTSTNGALSNGTAHHLNGIHTNGHSQQQTVETPVSNGHFYSDSPLEIQKLKNVTETLSRLTTAISIGDETNKEN